MSFPNREARRAFGIMQHAWRHREPADSFNRLLVPTTRRTGGKRYRVARDDVRGVAGNLGRLNDGE